MRIFLTGATGFVGRHAARALSQRGHLLTCLARPGRSTTGLESPPGVRVVRGEWTSPATWLGHIAGHDVVVNTIGVIRERPGASFRAVHLDSAVALFEAAKRAGVGKIVHLSALGADTGATSRYHLSKRAADERLAALGVPSVVLRPSFVYGPGDQSMTFFSRLAALPLTPVPGDGHYEVQPIWVGDIVRALVQAVERPELQNIIVDCGGPAPLTFADLLDELARRRGKARGARKLHLPWPLVGLVAALTDALGGRGPITRDELRMLRHGNVADPRPFVELFGFEPLPFAAALGRSG